METPTFSLLQERAAVKIAGYIKAQQTWITQQEAKLADTVLGLNVSDYDLRQLVAGLRTGKETLSYLKSYFLQFVGMDYDTYCEQNPEAIKVVTPEEKLLEAIKGLIQK